MVGRDIKNLTKQESLSITWQGKTFGIVNAGQKRLLLDIAKNDVVDDNPDMPMPQVMQEAEKIVASKGFSTLEDILSQMSPSEREQWKIQYRFGGILRRRHG